MAKQSGGNRNARNRNVRNNKGLKGVNKNRINLKASRLGTQKNRTGNRAAKARDNMAAKKQILKKQIKGTNVVDARQKIIQKKRKTVLDAREVLTQKAKTQDARSKIDKIRNGVRPGNSARGTNIKVIGSGIVKKTDSNGKVSLSTNKPNKNSTLGMNLAIQKQLGLVGTQARNPKKTPVKRGSAAIRTIPPRAQQPIRKTILNDFGSDFGYSSRMESDRLMYDRVYDPAVYKWSRPGIRPTSHIINSLESTRQAMRDVMREEMEMRAWPYYAPKTPRLAPTGYIDLDAVDEDMPMVTSVVTPSRISLHGSQRISNVHSRLDRLPAQTDTHGILAQTKTKVVVPAGHRIVVSNLQASVTQDDIKELFEDIGVLLTARLVRPGVAEVIYKNLKDAQRAVDTYHNRQLDGQPMKCLLVNKRPIDRPTGAPVKSDGMLGRKAVMQSSTPSEKLVPDISTIHKVLFQRK